ncbi:MAG: cytochrome c3 family protein [Gallionella sp.]
MKTSIAKLALGLTLVSMSGVAMAGISSTKHNLGGSFNGSGAHGPSLGFNFTTATTEICVFCHTPHGADSTAAVPLWNRTLTSNTYQTYASLGTSSFDGADNQPGGVSLACLSCHDGTQAMNTVINTPGGGTTGDVNISEYLGPNDTLPVYNVANGVTASTCVEAGTPVCGGFYEFNMMSQVSGEMIYLSTDLRNDHPISMQYAGAYDGGTQLDANEDFHPAFSAAAGAQTVFYVDSNGAGVQTGTKTKADFPLYNAGLSGEARVECATCHDPHSNNSTFLRLPNNGGSAVCLACHDK